MLRNAVHECASMSTLTMAGGAEHDRVPVMVFIVCQSFIHAMCLLCSAGIQFLSVSHHVYDGCACSPCPALVIAGNLLL
jgi:hypothetical protein